MGLFSFIGDIGDKLFGSDDDPAEKIQQHIESDNPGVENLSVGYQEGTVKLGGDAQSQEAADKAVLMAGNVQGVEKVDSEQLKAPPPTPEEAQVEHYTIVSGDTLSAIARKFLGDGNAYPKIFEANREVIKDPNKIYPGQVIRIPKA